MKSHMFLKFHGVRGSYSVPGPNTTAFGGNTTCVSIYKWVARIGKYVRVIIDAGTGATKAGDEILANYFAGKENLTTCILFTHLHPDHTEGFTFFAPNFLSQTTLHLMGMETLNKNVGRVLAGKMTPPTYPIEYDELKSRRHHYVLRDGQVFWIDETGSPVMPKKGADTPENAIFKVQVMKANAPAHPQQGALYYRITDVETGYSIACIWDCESSFGGDSRVIEFAKSSHILIHDSQYTSEEYPKVQNFGHSTHEMAVENATKAAVYNLFCTHFNPKHSDLTLLKLATEWFKKSMLLIHRIYFAMEDVEIDVDLLVSESSMFKRWYEVQMNCIQTKLCEKKIRERAETRIGENLYDLIGIYSESLDELGDKSPPKRP